VDGGGVAGWGGGGLGGVVGGGRWGGRRVVWLYSAR